MKTENIIILLLLVFITMTTIDNISLKNKLDFVYDKISITNTLVTTNYKTTLEIKEIVQKQLDLELSKKMTIVAYTATKKETDKTPNQTATMEKPKSGWTAAVSRDNLHLLGKRVYIEGIGVRYINDLTAEKASNKIDLCVGSVAEANKFGKKELQVTMLE